MKILGVNTLGWRMSSVLAFTLSLPFLYLFIRELWDRNTAIYAVLLFGFSKMAIGFAHLGYNNIQVYTVLLVSIGLMVWSVNLGSRLGYYLSGCVAGLGFYTYYTARLVPLIVIVLVIFTRGFKAFFKDWKRLVPLFLGILLVLGPLLLQFDTLISNMLQQTVVTGGNKIEPKEILVSLKAFLSSSHDVVRLLEHCLLSFVFGVWYDSPHHFQNNPIMDPMTGVLSLTGFWLTIMGCRSNVNLRYLVVVYLFSLLVVGGISQYSKPPLTRLMFLIPFMSIFAALALNRIRAVLTSGAGTRFRISGYFVPLILLFTIAWNPVSLYRHVIVGKHGYGEGTSSELIRVTKNLNEKTKLIYIQHGNSYMHCVDLVMESYDRKRQFLYLRPFNDQVINILRSVEPPFIVFLELKDSAEINSIQELMTKRFPDAEWQDTDPLQTWNLKYFGMPSVRLDSQNLGNIE